jgi:hypothetical protein
MFQGFKEETVSTVIVCPNVNDIESINKLESKICLGEILFELLELKVK